MWSSSCWLYKLLVGGHRETDMHQRGENNWSSSFPLISIAALSSLTSWRDLYTAAAQSGDGESGREHRDARAVQAVRASCSPPTRSRQTRTSPQPSLRQDNLGETASSKLAFWARGGPRQVPRRWCVTPHLPTPAMANLEGSTETHERFKQYEPHAHHRLDPAGHARTHSRVWDKMTWERPRRPSLPSELEEDLAKSREGGVWRRICQRPVSEHIIWRE
jgi:hypothetical protein